MKKVLITAGTVYGKLDDNKLVGNRVRGIWASKFANHLLRRGHEVTLLVADTQEKEIISMLDLEWIGRVTNHHALSVVKHNGFWDYRDKCFEMARTHHAAVMAAAVVNWIPETPFPGKMPTVGVGDRMMVPFILAPRVIDEMRKINPRLTLIGCKMTIGQMKPPGAAEDEVYVMDDVPLFDIAYKTLLQARCNVVIANDMAAGLKTKYLVYPDRTVIPFTLDGDDFRGDRHRTDKTMYQELEAVILDEHFHTEQGSIPWGITPDDRARAAKLFDMLVEKNRRMFKKRYVGSEHVFGAVAVRLPYGAALVSPREKGQEFTSKDAVIAHLCDDYDVTLTIHTEAGKASLNAPLLIRHLKQYPEAAAVVHFHQEPVPTLTELHAPPGTVRDNLRTIPAPIYTILGHGCIIAVDENGKALPWEPPPRV